MRYGHGILATVVLGLGAGAVAFAHAQGDELPAGPIRQRHELMEGIGKNAKVIGDALKSGDLSPVAAAADAVAQATGQVLPLFPPDSLHPKSRAKPEIWKEWKAFETATADMEKAATALAAAAREDGDVPAKAKALFGTCKGCHEKFRLPEE